MIGREIARRSFTSEDQALFARLSADDNPVHCDPVYARRTVFGEPIVHGVHLALWGVEAFLRARQDVALSSIAATFLRHVPLDRGVMLRIAEESAGGVTLTLDCDGQPATEIVLDVRTGVGGGDRRYAPGARAATKTAQHDLDSLRAGERGTVALTADPALLATTFPTLYRSIGAGDLAGLLAISFLVGKVRPGLHSVMSSFHITLGDPASASELNYELLRIDRRFALLTMKVGGCVAGEVRAFVRPPPVPQAPMAEVVRHVAPSEFSGTRALIIGGSRGLGEALAKVLTCGGADVVLTYKDGSADAKRTVGEIVHSGGTARCIRFDVADPMTGLDRLAVGWHPTDLYYCPTPKIGSARQFDQARFRVFAECYVVQFVGVCQALQARQPGPLRVFYPSSIAVEEKMPGLADYAAAKSAGETACAYLQDVDPNLRIEIERLPRMATDQTAALGKPLPTVDVLPLAIAAARRMAASESPAAAALAQSH